MWRSDRTEAPIDFKRRGFSFLIHAGKYEEAIEWRKCHGDIMSDKSVNSHTGS